MLPLTGHSTTYYVTTTGVDYGPGDRTTPWGSIAYAVGYNTPARDGDTIYVQAGTYAKPVSIQKDGITLIGYTNQPGDLHFTTFPDAIDPSIFPVLDGGNPANGRSGFDIRAKADITIMNFQITGYSYAFNAWGSQSITLDNVHAYSPGDVNASYSGRGVQFGSWGSSHDNYDNIIRNCSIENSAAEGITVIGYRNSIINCKVTCDRGATVNEATDYYILVGGNNNIIERCYVERIGDLKHSGHGITLKWKATGNIVKDCRAVNMKGEGFAVRHAGVTHNRFINCTATGGVGFAVRDGASYNVFEDCLADGCKYAYRLFDTSEEGTQYAGRHNVFDGCTVSNAYIGVWFDDYDQKSPADSNTWRGCTFENVDYLFGVYRDAPDNAFDSCTVTNCKSYSAGSKVLGAAWKCSKFSGNSFADPEQYPCDQIIQIDPVDTAVIHVDPDTIMQVFKPGYITIEAETIEDFNLKCSDMEELGFRPLFAVGIIVSENKKLYVQQWAAEK